jgi:hypothetical protein
MKTHYQCTRNSSRRKKVLNCRGYVVRGMYIRRVTSQRTSFPSERGNRFGLDDIQAPRTANQ